MVQPLSFLALFLIATTMGLALAHALEFPGKLRLDEDTYRAVQQIYYPGFTIGGLIGELGGLLVLIALLVLLPAGSERFWWTAAALAFMALLHGTYWLWTHPVNSQWLEDADLSGIGGLFFSTFAGEGADWQQLRNAWEYSHIARSILGAAAFLSMAMALTQ
ncbi:hypothetical protein [Roseovarius sp.]|uniref:hypothetical protein n=1 Tax=Roseovarius sp. TaxID=1486281 RepID=UPI003BAD1532